MDNFRQYKDWYKVINQKLIARYGQDVKLIAGLIAATSPRVHVKRNITTAIKIYDDFINNKENFVLFVENFKDCFLKQYKIFKPHYFNVLKTLKHDFTKVLNLSGQKVNNFYKNIAGDWEAVTLDVWMLKYFNIKKVKLNKTEYLKYTRIIKGLATKNNLKPCEMQAILWTKSRIKAGFKPSNLADYI